MILAKREILIPNNIPLLYNIFCINTLLSLSNHFDELFEPLHYIDQKKN